MGGGLLANDLGKRDKDGFDCLDALLSLDRVLDVPVDSPHLLEHLGLHDGRQHLVGGRRKILHQDKPLVISSRLGKVILLLLHDGDLYRPRGQLDDDLRRTSRVGGRIERPETGLNDCSHLWHRGEVFSCLRSYQERLEDCVIHPRTEASIVVVTLTRDDREVEET